jgi:hypothetical protein
MTRTVFGLLALGLGALTLAPLPVQAAAYDGKWVADIPAEGRCNTTGTMTFLVADGEISGQVQNAHDRATFTGKVDAEGNATFLVNRSYVGTMIFRGDHFDATWHNNLCDRHASGEHAPSDARRAELAAERLKHQAAYADLVRRAEAGDKTVDYTALRTESVYAKDWDFYDTKARGLLDQANASVKGKDCALAMVTLEQVIKLDFTIDSAHALRSDCLKQAGDQDKARIENDIAKGLIHSLMDSDGGDRGLVQTLTASAGSAEQSAYVVSTMREEMDVLANRHIQIKTRQTEIRGSNGHYYDLIHGIAIYTGPGRLDANVKDIYFDISSFMAGRASRRAVAELSAAQVQ